MGNVLVIGNGAREHALAESLRRSPQNIDISAYMTANNPGIAKLACCTAVGEIDVEKIKTFAESVSPKFAIIGPEGPLALGLADALEEAGIPCIGPKKELARIETSKAFARELLDKHNIPGNPRFKVFTSDEGIKEWITELGEYVVKADGLHGGKGVKVSGSHLKSIKEGVEYAKACIQSDGTVLIEEKLVGEEFSLMAFADGKTVVSMPCVQDHKRAFENDEGPNTGGMGSYSDANHTLPFLTEKDVKDAEEINSLVCKALKEDIGSYHGILYGGFMVTKDGVKLIEYNARFGDPEAMNVLEILETDLVEICEKIIKEELDTIQISFKKQATVCKYVVPKGYPDNPVKGVPIKISKARAQFYFAAIDEQNGELIMTGSRAIGVVATGDTITEAEKIAEEGVSHIQGDVFSRKDIGTQELIDKRTKHMEELR